MNCKICGKEFQDTKELTKHLVKEHKFSIEQIYSYYNFSFETMEASCPICGSSFSITKRQLKKYKDGVSKGIGCCLKCSRSLINIIYGSPFSSEEVREKAKQTMLDKYGVTSSLKLSEVREKGKETMLKKYGVEYCTQSKEVQDRIKKTNLERYGGIAPASSKEVQERMKQTNLERYGGVAPVFSEEIQEKIKQTNLEKYGVENASSSNEVKERRKQTMLDKYGVEHVSQIPEVKKRAQENLEKTNLKKYGVRRPAQSSEIQDKTKQTNKEKYGVEYSIRAEETQEKIKQTNIERYGCENVFQNPEIREKAEQSNLAKYGYKHASQSPEVQEKIRQVNRENYGVDYFCQHERCNQANGFRISKANKKFQEFLLENNIESELEFIIENNGYDLKVGEILIEINPYFTHNSTVGPFFGDKRRDPKPEDYHLSKTLLAKEKGYHCIHIFDWEDEEKVMFLLKDKVKVFARNCELKELNKKQAHEFLGKYHIQGSTKSLKYAYGLFYNSELVEVMTFGTPRYNKKYEYELLRLCTAPGVSVVGGASKLLKHFEEQVKPTSIISYCDLSKFDGAVYEKLGFKLESQTPPTRHWYNPRTKMHVTDNLLRQRGFDQLHKTNFGKGTSNEQLMLEHGYLEIYDCGQLVFVKKLV